MIEHNKNFYSLEELKRTRDNLEGYLDNEEVYYFVGAIRYACDEIERLNKIIKHVEDICESSIVSVNQILQDEKETKIINGRCINRNEYQIVRLKAYRTKSKEILERIKELKGSDKEW